MQISDLSWDKIFIPLGCAVILLSCITALVFDNNDLLFIIIIGCILLALGTVIENSKAKAEFKNKDNINIFNVMEIIIAIIFVIALIAFVIQLGQYGSHLIGGHLP